MPTFSPADLTAAFHEKAAGLSSAQLLTDRANRRLLEMWCAATFGTGFSRVVSPCQIDIELEDEQREYDFHLLSNGARYPVQLAEVIDEGRLRDYEYKTLSREQIEQLFRERPMRTSEYAAARVQETLNRKIAKHYAGMADLHILLYININARQVTWASLRNVAENECKNFASVWLFNDDIFCCLWGGKYWHGIVGWKGING